MVTNFNQPKYKVMDFSGNSDNSQKEVLKRTSQAITDFVKSQVKPHYPTISWESDDENCDVDREPPSPSQLVRRRVAKNPAAKFDTATIDVKDESTAKPTQAVPQIPTDLRGHKGLAALLRYLIELQIYEENKSSPKKDAAKPE